MADIKDRVKGAIDTGADKAKGMADQAAGAAKNAADRLPNNGPGGSEGQQGGSFVDTVRDNAQSAMSAVGDYAGQARDMAGNAADRVQHWAEDAYDYAGKHAGDLGQEMTSLIRRYPVQALLVGFGVGLLLGRVVRA
jgi:ElaB/YqjD/DUF883 family membrane-anchored ribosome-binding protein